MNEKDGMKAPYQVRIIEPPQSVWRGAQDEKSFQAKVNSEEVNPLKEELREWYVNEKAA